MLHPYSIFFKAMWETPPTPHNRAVPERRRRMRWLRWSAAGRRHAAEQAVADAGSTGPLTLTPTRASRGGVPG
jgi:hypothetical protein